MSRAETVGFEPTVLLKGRLVSSEVLSTTQPRLQVNLLGHFTLKLPAFKVIFSVQMPVPLYALVLLFLGLYAPQRGWRRL